MRLLALTFIFFLTFVDYLSKSLIQDYVKNGSYKYNDLISFEIFHNRGIAFSVFNSDSLLANTILAIIIGAVILYIFYLFLRDFDILEKFELLGYMLILGGAFGNFLDRISNGSVLDFIIINYDRVYFPAVFNVADILISFGAFLIIYSFLFIKKND